MASVVDKISELGVQVEHIPGGCTGLCQPIDIGIGKPLKSRVRNLWEDWMIEQGGETIRFTPPTRERVAGWVIQSLQNISSDITKRSWRHQPLCLVVDGRPNNNKQENNNNQQQNDNNQENDNEQQSDNNEQEVVGV